MNFVNRKMVVWLFVAIGLFGAAIGFQSGASAQQPASILVQASICPAEYADQNWEADCDPLPDVDASVYIDASEYGFSDSTDANGEASFEVEGAGPFVVELGVPGDFAGFMSYCGVVGVPEPLQVEGANSNRMIVPVGEGQEIGCSFFVSPVDAQGEVAGEPVDALPTTGVGSVMNGESGLATVFMLIGGVVLLAGLGMLTMREDLFER